MSRLVPRQPVPDLALPSVDGDTWRLGERKPAHFSMLVFYRGLHCPICKAYLRDLDRRVGDFAARGVEAVAISCDSGGRAAEAKTGWHIEELTIAHDLSIDEARQWGLYISSGIGKTSTGLDEPALFCEPGLFLVRPDRSLYAANIITMPFARPDFAAIDAALERIIARDYPARGEA